MKQILFLNIMLITLGSVACNVPLAGAPATSMPTPIAPPASSYLSSPIDPCMVLTQADIETVLGESVVLNPIREMVSNGSLCGYFIGSRSLVITVRQCDRAGIQTVTQELKERSKGSQPWTGIGDIAFFSYQDKTQNPNMKAGTVSVIKGIFSLEISLADAGLSEAKAGDALKFWAQKAVTRLP